MNSICLKFCFPAICLVLMPVASAIAADNDRFWGFVDRVVQSHPDAAFATANVGYQSALYASMGWWEDPSVEVLQTSRNAQGQDSTVLGFALRQRLPFWSAKSRHRPAQQALVEATKFQVEDEVRMLERETVQKLYLFARAKLEQHHLAERRARLNLLKNALQRTKAASPGQKVERSLVSSAIVLTEEQFDTMDSDVASRSSELQRLGLDDKSSVTVNWIRPEVYRSFLLEVKSASPRPNPIVENKRKLSQSSLVQRDSLQARPEFDFFAQTDEERGGARERNLAFGLGIRIPVNAIFGSLQKVGDAEVLKARAEQSREERKYSVRLASLEVELALVEKSIARLSLDKMQELETVVEASEAEARRGWVTVPQLLELERQMHAQIEATYDAQMRAVTLIKEACDYYTCDARKYLGGSL